MIKIIGVTGPSASGKSRLCKYISEYPCIDADELYHSMLNPPSKLLSLLRCAFGDTIFFDDGTLNRAALSAKVFSDQKKLELLNATVLPEVLSEIRVKIREYEEKGFDAVIIDAPTLIESGFHKECDLVVSVITPPDVRITRAMLRDGIDKDRAAMRIFAQKNDEFYTSVSDRVIINDNDKAVLAKEARALCDIIKKL